jgi:hypothetical protein
MSEVFSCFLEMRSVLSSGQITLCSPLFSVAAYMGKEDFCSSFQHSQDKKISRMLAEQLYVTNNMSFSRPKLFCHVQARRSFMNYLEQCCLKIFLLFHARSK